jgi:glycine dehydrogenase subunit 1
VLDLKQGADAANAGLLEKKIIGGLALEQWYPELGPGATLWCATEVTTRKQMDAAAEALVAVEQPELAGAKV